MEGAHDDWSWPQPPPGTFRDNLRAMVRRRPGTVERKVGVSRLLAPVLVLAVCAGSVAAAPPYALVTQVGEPRPARDGSPGPAGPG